MTTTNTTAPKDFKPAPPLAAAPASVTLEALCKELKVHPREARMMLRFAAKQKAKYPNLGKEHVARQPWSWAPGSKALAEAKKALTEGSA